MSVKTSSLVVEVASAEIPAFIQESAAKQLLTSFCSSLEEISHEYHCAFSQATCRIYSTPQRIAFHYEQLNLNSIEQTASSSPNLIKGPKVTAAPAALAGFMQKYNVPNQDALSIIDGIYYLAQPRSLIPIETALSQAITRSISAIKWPKSMRWQEHSIRWIRPIKSILCLLDDQIIPVSFGHLVAGRQTYGHRLLSPYPIDLTTAAEYAEVLKKSWVIINRADRCTIIQNAANKIANELGFRLIDNQRLLEEIADLVEWPVVLCGRIPEEFLQLPREVLITSIRYHQKYMMLEDQNGAIAPYFIVVANTTTPDDATIIRGNEKVIAARLNDARFFFSQDKSFGLENYRSRLSQITFHRLAGTMAEKTERITAIALRLLDHCATIATLSCNNRPSLPAAADLERAAALCKADLASEMVKEFPELQGIMGYYYATAAAENHDICLAIRNHYKPQGPSDELAPHPLTGLLAIADKLDTIVELFAAGIKPSGSKDPFALRRAAIGILRLIETNCFPISISEIAWLPEEVREFITKRSAQLPSAATAAE